MFFSAKRVFLFLFVGGFAALINWLCRILFSNWMIFELAVFLAYIVGMIIGYIGYRFLVFQASNSSVQAEIMRFILVNIFSGIIVIITASILVRFILPALGLPYYIDEIGHAIAIAIGAFINYFAHAYITFAKIRIG